MNQCTTTKAISTMVETRRAADKGKDTMGKKKGDEEDTDAQQLEELPDVADQDDPEHDPEQQPEQEPVHESDHEYVDAIEDEDNDAENDEDGDDDDDDDDDELAGHGLLQRLNTDIESYEKKVEQEKNKGEDHGMLRAVTKAAAVPAAAVPAAEDAKASRKRKRVVDEVPTSKVEKGQQQREKKNAKTTRGWTKMEDDAIVYYKEEMKYSWRKIEQLLDHRHTWQAIQMRYLRTHKSRNDEWSRFMEVKFTRAVQKDWENRWKRIAADLGPEFTAERCVTKNIDICKKIEYPNYASLFDNKVVQSQYEGEYNDIKDPEAHKKLMLVYLGLDAISYDDSENEAQGEGEAGGDVQPAQGQAQAVEVEKNVEAAPSGEKPVEADTSAAKNAVVEVAASTVDAK